jgi:hypothetical protein
LRPHESTNTNTLFEVTKDSRIAIKIYFILINMVLPLIKLMIVSVKVLARPMVTFMKGVTMSKGGAVLFRPFCAFGQWMYRFEINMQQRSVSASSKAKLPEIQPLSDEIAFEKGAETFVELVFFYGVMLVISYYEVKKNVQQARKTRESMEYLLHYA